MAEKAEDILLGRSGTCRSTYRENERTISLAVCARQAQIRLFSPPIVTQSLIFSFLSKQTLNLISTPPPYRHTIEISDICHKLQEKLKNKIGCRGAV